ncbi:hypothetical protein C8R44DRAFT_649363 [Mycena epipterygia]|nr:hypothetical protein C8R44DRAFT_649363 [Mycena epipterygia]
MLGNLWNWSSDEDPDSSILWLHGPAGSGKSAIAQSFCQTLEAEGRLAGSFFFKRGHPSRGNAKKLFPTIAYQVALLLPELNRFISQTMERDPSIVDKSLPNQLASLIVEPCRQATFHHVIVIDGLDECEGEIAQQQILRSIGDAIHAQPPNLRFLVASRPEPHIREMFEGSCLEGRHRPLNIHQSFQDVHHYLQDEFARIHREHYETMASIPNPWPSPELVEVLVEKSSGYFIYASTVIKFIDDKHFRPTDRLETLMGFQSGRDSESPFDPLDQLYTQILSGVPQASLPRLLKILTVVMARMNLRIPQMEQLLELQQGDVRLTLRDLHSVIELHRDDSGVTVHHASFLDFLEDPVRAGAFYVGDSQHRLDLARHILKACSYTHNDPLLNRNCHVAW